MAKQNAITGYRPKGVTWKKDFQKNGLVYLLYLPILVYFIIFNYIPMAGVMMAFEDYKVNKGLFASKWVGWANFQKLFTGDMFLNAFRNTTCMAVLSLILGFLPPIILAILFSECKPKRFKRVTQIMSYMPNFVSAVVVCALVTEFVGMNGAVTQLLCFFGAEKQNWLANSNIPVFWLIYVFMGIWVSFGYGSIIYTTAISNVSGEIKEAAALDGANRFQRVWHIILPSIKNLCIIQLTMAVGTMFMVGFDRVLLLYMPKTYETSDVLYTYTYRMAFGNKIDYGVSTASSLFQSVLGTTLLLSSNALTRKFSEYSLF
ncbi:MAG: sugar ABC transporter permease [Clostridia bacterium]|nr:sugar ABC transporter permease [Clostridia bacterium]